VNGYTGETLRRAQRLRLEMTEAERKLWSVLRNRGIEGAKFRRQQPIGPFIADFVCQERRLIIEADGGQHADRLADASRTAFLESKGYRVLHFWNNDILKNIDGERRRSPASSQPLTPLALCASRPLPRGERD
jgi:very-short-patch-repair endonuclease